MIKNIRILFFTTIFAIFSNNVLALSSSSYLISNVAYKNYDFTRVLYEFSSKNEVKRDYDYTNELIASTITENLILAKKISNTLLSIDLNNQEAKLFKFVNLIASNNKNEIKKNIMNNQHKNEELFNFIFFENEELKTKEDISNSLIEIVKSSYSDNRLEFENNYNFLLFYTSLSTIISENNYEALFIKAQLFQIIEKYYLAEVFYKKIPPSSEYYIDAQVNIAFNYSKYLDFFEVEKNIKNLIISNKENYHIKKILADFYRVEEKYDEAINLYEDLILQNKTDLWNIYYLRGICYERKNNWVKAEKDFLKSLNLKPDSPNVLNYLAYGWIEKDINIEKSLTMLKKAYEANPDSYYILDSLAWAYYKKNDFKKAVILMEKVIDMAPGEAISLDHLGDIYFALNRKREAMYFWNQAKDLAKPQDKITEKINQKILKLNAG